MFARQKISSLRGVKANRLENFIVFGSLVGLCLLHLLMAWTFEVNWDEFYRLADIYRWKAGTLGSVLQTNYVYVFSWLDHVHQNEVYQIIAARGVMCLLLFYSCTLIYFMARYFFDTASAGMMLIAFLSFSFVFRHATSFRVDLPVLTLSLTAIALLILSKRSLVSYVLAGICLGLAGSISIKAGLFIPTISVLLLLYWWNSGWSSKVMFRSFIMGFVAFVTFCSLIYLHNQSLPDVTVKQGFSGYAVSTAILGYGVFPQARTIFFALDKNSIYFVLFLSGLVFSIFRLKAGEGRFKTLLVLTVSIGPLLSLIFYVHTFAYFYTTMLATGSFMVGLTCFHLKAIYRHANPLVTAMILISAAPMMISSLKQTNAYQKQISQVVHEMFPEPVNYIDRASQISAFPKQGLFMSNVLMDDYTARAQPIMPEIFETAPPQFLLANLSSLDLDNVRDETPTRRFLAEDERLLIDNFIHHWGAVYVPGKHLKSDTPNTGIRIELPGIYTIESASDVIIKGRTYRPEQIIFLEKGEYNVDLRDNTRLTLRWGDNIYRPEFDPLGDVVFRGF